MTSRRSRDVDLFIVVAVVVLAVLVAVAVVVVVFVVVFVAVVAVVTITIVAVAIVVVDAGVIDGRCSIVVGVLTIINIVGGGVDVNVGFIVALQSTRRNRVLYIQ